MTELESFLLDLKARGTRLTVEREKLPMYTGKPVFHYRFWLCGIVFPSDFAMLHRFKPQLVAYLIENKRFEMSAGDTHTGQDAKPFVPAGRTRPNVLLASRAAVTHYTALAESVPQEALAEVRVASQSTALIPDESEPTREKRRVRLVSGKVVWL